MGLRFRKSFKIAPGVKLNLNKNSVSLTAGAKGAHYTVNSNGKRTASVGLPGTGLYYTQSSGKSASNGNAPKKGSCLMSLLKIFGILILIPLLFCFGWIIGIIWLLFFRKRMDDTPEKQKKITVGVIIYCIISFILTIYIFITAPPSVESLKISSTVADTTLEVGQDYEIKISSSPKDSSLDNIRYHISGGSGTFKSSDSKNIAILHTTSEGTVTIYISSGDVASNSLTFKIIDSTKEEVINTVPDSANPLQNESKSTEQPINTDSNSISSNEPESSTDASAAPANEPSVNPDNVDSSETSTESTDNSTNDNMVWIDDTAKKYHRNPNCSNMSDPYQVTLNEAIAREKVACKKCY